MFPWNVGATKSDALVRDLTSAELQGGNLGGDETCVLELQHLHSGCGFHILEGLLNSWTAAKASLRFL